MSECVFTAIVGIGGTLAGTILGWLLNTISRRGRLKPFITKWEEEFKWNVMGRMEPAPSYDEAEEYSFSLTFDVYNSSSDTKIMRDFRIEFLKGHKVAATGIPLNDDDKGALLCRYMETLNVPPKSVVSVHLIEGFWRSDFSQFDNINASGKVRLAYKNEKGADRHIVIDVMKGGTRFDRIERNRK